MPVCFNLMHFFDLPFSARIVPSRYMEKAKVPKKLPGKVNISTSEQSKAYFVRGVSQELATSGY